MGGFIQWAAHYSLYTSFPPGHDDVESTLLMVIMMMMMMMMMTMAFRQIPTMTKSHHGGNMSLIGCIPATVHCLRGRKDLKILHGGFEF